MFVPLTGIIWELFDNVKIPTIAVDIGGRIYGKKNGLRAVLNEDDVFSGNYVRMIMHPESLMNNQVEALMLKLKINQLTVFQFKTLVYTLVAIWQLQP